MMETTASRQQTVKSLVKRFIISHKIYLLKIASHHEIRFLTQSHDFRLKSHLMVRFDSAKVMPHSGSIVRAHRHRRVVERREKIGPDVVDFRCGLTQSLHDVLDMGALQLSETLLHDLRGNVLTTDPHGGRGAAQHIHHEL